MSTAKPRAKSGGRRVRAGQVWVHRDCGREVRVLRVFGAASVGYFVSFQAAVPTVVSMSFFRREFQRKEALTSA